MKVCGLLFLRNTLNEIFTTPVLISIRDFSGKENLENELYFPCHLN